MDRHLISLAVAILLVYVGPGATQDDFLTPQQIENELAAHAGSSPHTPQFTPNEIRNSTCWGRGDVRYRTLDGLEFSYNTPINMEGVMVMPWEGLPWWVVTYQELFNGGPKTRFQQVYVKCSDMLFATNLGPTVYLWHWTGTGWTHYPVPFNFGDVIASAFDPRGFTLSCNAVPMTVSVALHSVWITMTPLHSAANLGVRGICGDYNGDATNDYSDLEPETLPPWKPFLLPK